MRPYKVGLFGLFRCLWLQTFGAIDWHLGRFVVSRVFSCELSGNSFVLPSCERAVQHHLIHLILSPRVTEIKWLRLSVHLQARDCSCCLSFAPKAEDAFLLMLNNAPMLD